MSPWWQAEVGPEFRGELHQPLRALEREAQDGSHGLLPNARS